MFATHVIGDIQMLWDFTMNSYPCNHQLLCKHNIFLRKRQGSCWFTQPTQCIHSNSELSIYFHEYFGLDNIEIEFNRFINSNRYLLVLLMVPLLKLLRDVTLNWFWNFSSTSYCLCVSFKNWRQLFNLKSLYMSFLIVSIYSAWIYFLIVDLCDCFERTA